jgi:hypothetical protein
LTLPTASPLSTRSNPSSRLVRAIAPANGAPTKVESEVVEVRQVVLDGVILIAADGVNDGTLYADDSLARPVRSQS